MELLLLINVEPECDGCGDPLALCPVQGLFEHGGKKYCSRGCATETNPLCTCGEVATKCDPNGMEHFNRMREKDNHTNEGECGIFSGMEPDGEPECDNCGALGETLSDGYCQGCICSRCKKNAGVLGQSMNDMGFCDPCNTIVYSAVSCNGGCEPMCDTCNRLADQAADNRVAEQGY